MPGIIQSIQQVAITIPNSVASATGTLITPVVMANAAIFPNGRTTTNTTNQSSQSTVAFTLTNPTTVTAARSATGTDSVTCEATVVEFIPSVVNSIQYCTIPLTTTSGTYTFSSPAPGPNSFVILTGSTSGSASLGASVPMISLNQGTGVVTAYLTAAPTGTTTAYVCLVDLTSAAIASVQQAQASGSVKNVTIASVVPGNTILVSGGLESSIAANYGFVFYAQLTSPTTVVFTRGTAGTNAINALVTAVQFQPGVLTANGVQRNTTTIPVSGVTQTSTLAAAVDRTYALCNYCGFCNGALSGNLIAQMSVSTIQLTDGSTVTSTVAVAPATYADTTSWEVVEFAPLSAAPPVTQARVMVMA